MIIKFSPVRMDETLMVDREGDTLIVNGKYFDFSPLMEGDTLPVEAIDSTWFIGQVDRIDGELNFTLVLPHGPNAPVETRFPETLVVDYDGSVDIPVHDIPKENLLPDDEIPETLPIENDGGVND